ncbi:MAG TPA: winged helix family transcriptional regulator, partial [Terrimesophilobacter sp.]|nr:winged helix family transcriptional regulator [Terrimesophilobacter sp.]
MSLATLDRPRTTLAPAWAPTPVRTVAPAPAPAAPARPVTPPPTRLTAVPDEKEARGVALYIGLD